MRNLPDDVTRCHGLGCPVAEDCERHRQIGRDEMRPHGTGSARIPYAGSLRIGRGPCRHRIVPAESVGEAVAGGNGPARPQIGPQGDFSGAGVHPTSPPGSAGALEGQEC